MGQQFLWFLFVAAVFWFGISSFLLPTTTA